MKNFIFTSVSFFYCSFIFGQLDSLTNEQKDSLYIFEVQDKHEKDKVLHAEPLYIDLIRDLGARKGEREWNVGLGMADNLTHDAYEVLVEYEWAVIDRLGLEVEVPVMIYSSLSDNSPDSIPESSIESLKMATQWSFFVNENISTSLALGYIHEFEFSSFKNFGSPLFKGQLFNPFFIAAKRWGSNFHSLIYTGPRYEHEWGSFNEGHFEYELHTNFHYMISGTRNFIGIEVNKYFSNTGSNITLRPQMRVSIADNFLIGIVPGIPLNRKEERLSMFLRFIWEPKDHHK
jgi:hypothetical protein